MQKGSEKNKILFGILCLALVIWGLTDVRSRAHFDPEIHGKGGPALADHRTDLTVFTEAGEAFFDGRDPYEVTNPRGWKYLYPPLFAILMAPLSYLQPQWQGVVWYFISLAFAWGCYRETLRLLRIAAAEEIIRKDASGNTWLWIQMAAGAAILFPTLECLQRGQVGIFILFLMLLGLRKVLVSESWAGTAVGGGVLSLAVVIKVIPIMPVVFLLFLLVISRVAASPGRIVSVSFLGTGAGVLAGLLLFLFLLPSVVIGWQANSRHLETWAKLVGTRAVKASTEAHFSNPRGQRNQSLDNALYYTGNQVAFWVSPETEPNPWLKSESPDRFMNSPKVTQFILVIRILLGLILVPVGWRAVQRGGTLEGLAAWGLACAAMLIASPVARGHYYMLELPAVLFVSLWVWKHKGPKWALVCAGVPGLLSPLFYGFITFPQIFGFLGVGTLFLGTLGIGTTLWYLAMAVMLTLRPSRRPETIPAGPSG